MLIRIDKNLTDELVDTATKSERKRKNHNFHQTADDRLQRMLHAMNPGTYVQPHKHEDPDKREVFIVLTGSVYIILFTDDGSISEWMLLDSVSGNFGAEIPPRCWHTLIALEQGTVVYEVKDGPYLPIDDKNFAPWAPAEGDTDCESYQAELLHKILSE